MPVVKVFEMQPFLKSTFHNPHKTPNIFSLIISSHVTNNHISTNIHLINMLLTFRDRDGAEYTRTERL